MSLIEEALRRVQDPRAQHATPAAPQAPPKTPPAPEPPAHSWSPSAALPATATAAPAVNPMLAVALTVMALTALVIGGGMFWMRRAVGAGAATAPAETSPAAQAERRIAPEPAVEVEGPKAQPPIAMPWGKTPAEEFALSGVLEGPGESYAVINDLIVGVGERVGNATLVKIANGAVTLRRENGSEIVLRVPR
jgi:hypothetical protein